MTEQKDRELYRWLRLIREFEDRISALDKQGKLMGGVYSGKGQEAVTVGFCHDLRWDDWIFPLHRDLGAYLVKGADPKRLMAQIFGKRDGFAKGKDSYLHGGDLSNGIFGSTSMLAATLPVAAGMAYKFKIRKEDRVAIAFFGEGASSRGDVHEAMNFAGVHKLPVVFVCENNFYAYSTPNELQFGVDDVADRAVGYGFKGEVVSGNDLHAVMKSAAKAIARARKGDGPTLVECKTYRYHGHSEHDRADYRSEEEVITWESRDPIFLWENYLEMRKYDIESDPEGNFRGGQADRGGGGRVRRGQSGPGGARGDGRPVRHADRHGGPVTMLVTYIEAIRQAMDEEMARDRNVMLLGEDVGVLGGAFKTSAGLLEKHGADRVVDTPISESLIIGAGVGLAVQGMRPILELQFIDFISCGFDQIVNTAATLRYRHGGQTACPIVIRGPSGGGVHGGLYHSQNPEAWFCHVPGLKVVAPATAYDAKGLLKSAIRDDDPVLYFEHKFLYRRIKEEIPAEDFVVPIGKAALRKEGRDLTVITYGAPVHAVMKAARDMASEVDIEVIDLRTLLPIDWAAVKASARKTGKVLIVHEARLTGGIGGEVAARIAQDCFEDLDGPVMRLCARDVHTPFAPAMEEYVLPNQEKITEAIRKLAAY